MAIIACIAIVIYLGLGFIKKGRIEGFFEEHRIPRVIWSYWDKPTKPQLVEHITRCWSSRLSGWTIHHLNNDTYMSYLPKGCSIPNMSNLKPAHFADWLRLKLLETHGGVWMDASIVPRRDTFLNSMHHQIDINSKYEVYVCHSGITDGIPLIENFFIIAPPQSPFIKDWLSEYEKAIAIGFETYRDVLMNKNPEHIDLKQIQKIYASDDTYLTQHVCAQVVIQRRGSHPNYILTTDAYDSLYAHVKKNGWNCQKNMEELIYTDLYDHIDMVKLIRYDRQVLEADTNMMEQWMKKFAC